MASAEEKEIEQHLQIALSEVGKIHPWFSKDFNAWIFSHEALSCRVSGNTKKEVIQNYPLYLKEFIKHRLHNKLSPLMENKTKGHGGKRQGAGRPQGSKKEEKVRVYLPTDIASWIKQPDTIMHIRKLMQAYK